MRRKLFLIFIAFGLLTVLSGCTETTTTLPTTLPTSLSTAPTIPTSTTTSLLTSTTGLTSTDDKYYERALYDFFIADADSVVITDRYERDLPDLMTSLNSRYPAFGNKRIFTYSEKVSIYAENVAVMADAYAAIAEGRLAKHPAADGQFYGTISSDARAVTAEITINPSLKGSRSLAVYAAPGEIVEITFPAAIASRLEAAGMVVSVGYFSKAVTDMKTADSLVRLPVLTLEFPVTGTALSVGSPFGGMVYLDIGTYDGSAFTVVADGGIETPYYSLGSTTVSEWRQSLYGGGLYAELRAGSISFILPTAAARTLDDPYEVMSFWNDVVNLSAAAVAADPLDRPILMSYDDYVSAGAAVAYIGQSFCMLPTTWAEPSLDVDSILQDGLWGVFHELNHHFQGYGREGGPWGIANSGEITNNALTTAAYVLYTNIASYRTVSGYGSDWSFVADGYSSLSGALSGFQTSMQIRNFATLIHSFGVDAFIALIQAYYERADELPAGISRDSEDAFCYLASLVFQRDMTYYCASVFDMTISFAARTAIYALNYEVFIPAFNLYCSAVGDVATGRPFYIPYGADYVFDFRAMMAIPIDYYTIEVSGFENGLLVPLGDDVYVYTPDSDANDRFALTIRIPGISDIVMSGEIRQDTGAIEAVRYDGVDFITLSDALNEENYDGYLMETERVETIKIPSYDGAASASFAILEGKIVPDRSGVYTFFIKGADEAAFYLNDKGSYRRVCYINAPTGNYDTDNPDAQHTIFLLAGKAYEFKLVNFNASGWGSATVGWARRVPGDEQTGYIIDAIPSYVIYASQVPVTLPSKKVVPEEPDVYDRVPNVDQAIEIAGITNLSAPAGDYGTEISWLTDGDDATVYRSTMAADPDPFPLLYRFELPIGSMVNQLRVAFAADALPENIEIRAGVSLATLEVVFSGPAAAVVLADFPAMTVRYVEILILHTSGPEVSIGLADFSCFLRYHPAIFVDDANYALDWHGVFTVDRTGAFGNGGAYAGAGTVQFRFVGTAIGWYGETGPDYGIAEYSIDGSDWFAIDLSGDQSASLTLIMLLTDLELGEHILMIRGPAFNVDFFAIQSQK